VSTEIFSRGGQSGKKNTKTER